MIQNTRARAFTIFELFRENQQGGSKNILTEIRVKKLRFYNNLSNNYKILCESSSFQAL